MLKKANFWVSKALFFLSYSLDFISIDLTFTRDTCADKDIRGQPFNISIQNLVG